MSDSVVAGSLIGDLQIAGGIRINGNIVTVSKGYLLSLSKRTKRCIGKRFLAVLCDDLSRGGRRAVLDIRTQHYLRRLIQGICHGLRSSSGGAGRRMRTQRLYNMYCRFPCTWKEVNVTPNGDGPYPAQQPAGQQTRQTYKEESPAGCPGGEERTGYRGVPGGPVRGEGEQECSERKLEDVSMYGDGVAGEGPVCVQANAGEAADGCVCGDGVTAAESMCGEGEAAGGSLCGDGGTAAESMCGDGEAAGGSLCGDGGTAAESMCGEGEAAGGSMCGDEVTAGGSMCGDGVTAGGSMYGDGGTASEYVSGDEVTAGGFMCGDGEAAGGSLCGDGVTAAGSMCGDGVTAGGSICGNEVTAGGYVCGDEEVEAGLVRIKQEADSGDAYGEGEAASDPICGDGEAEERLMYVGADDEEAADGAVCIDREVAWGSLCGDREATGELVNGDGEAADGSERSGSCTSVRRSLRKSKPRETWSWKPPPRSRRQKKQLQQLPSDRQGTASALLRKIKSEHGQFHQAATVFRNYADARECARAMRQDQCPRPNNQVPASGSERDYAVYQMTTAVGVPTSPNRHHQEADANCNTAMTPGLCPNIKTEPPDDLTVEEPAIAQESFYQSVKVEDFAEAASESILCSICNLHVGVQRAELTLHMKCHHPEAIRSGHYRILDNEPSITAAMLRCDVCTAPFDRESTLIVHAWTHLAARKAAKEKEEEAIAKVMAEAEEREKEMLQELLKPKVKPHIVPYGLRSRGASKPTSC